MGPAYAVLDLRSDPSWNGGSLSFLSPRVSDGLSPLCARGSLGYVFTIYAFCPWSLMTSMLDSIADRDSGLPHLAYYVSHLLLAGTNNSTDARHTSSWRLRLPSQPPSLRSLPRMNRLFTEIASPAFDP